MPSKFPGMDPYLEGPMWPDFHSSFIPLLRGAIVRQLPERYAAIVGQHVWLEEPHDDLTLLGSPDVSVSERFPHAGTNGPATALLEAPTVARLQPVSARPGSRFIRITDRDTRRVVTVIELLSPSNKKPGKDRNAYLQKRYEYEEARVNLLELDFLRDGPRMPLGEPAPALTDYVILLLRGDRYPEVGLWPFSVRDPFPHLVVPLARGDSDLCIDLAGVFRDCYEMAGYRRTINYAKPAEPPLRPADADWAAALLPAQSST
jgi:hypothetical protein